MGFWNGKSEEQERAEALQEAHNKGQSDASNGVNEKPHDWLEVALSERKAEINEAYAKGQENANNQK